MTHKAEHTFDWKGFFFCVKLLVGALLLGAGGYYGFTYTKTLLAAPAQTTPVLQTATSPAEEKFSTSTPQRVINRLTIAEAVPRTGKFIAADLEAMQVTLYQDGVPLATYPIATKGRPGTPWETPAGFYAVETKERDHFSSLSKVHMPYSMQFYGNYFIHGWPYYPDGTPVASTFSGGCIRLNTKDAEKIFAFANRGTGLFVYDTQKTTNLAPLVITANTKPLISAHGYLVADLDTGSVYLEQDAAIPRTMGSITKLMSALVANETINFEARLTVQKSALVANAPDAPLTFLVEDLLYPLILQSNDTVAETLARRHGTTQFVRWMNTAAKALGMENTTFVDASGQRSTTTPDDVFRLLTYLANKKSFIVGIMRTENKTIVAQSGEKITITQTHANAASVVTLSLGGTTRRIAVVVLESSDERADIAALTAWITSSAKNSANAACPTCAFPQTYREIEF